MDILQGVFLRVLGVSLSGTLMMGMLFLSLKMFGKRLSKTACYYLLGLVLFRMLFPWQPEGGILQITTAQIQGITQQIISFGTDGDESNAILPSAVPEKGEIIAGTTLSDPLRGSLLQEDYGVQAQSNLRSEGSGLLWDQMQTPLNGSRTILIGAAFLWACGVLLMLGYKILTYIRFIGLVKHQCRPVRNGLLNKAFQDAADENQSKRIELYRSPAVKGPLLIGLLRPVIILPSLMTADEGNASLPVRQQPFEEAVWKYHYILKHELVHEKRKDIAYKWLMQLACCIHWFNPAVYLLSAAVEKACELACDEAVCRGLSLEDRKQYGAVLLSAILSEEKAGVPSTSLVTAMSSDGKKLKERLTAIKEGPGIFGRGLCLSMACLLSLFTLGIGSVRIDATAGQPPFRADYTGPEIYTALLASSLTVTAASQNQVLSMLPETEEGSFHSYLNLSFTVPENIPDGYKVWNHFAGRYETGAGMGVSSHLFDEESLNFSWIPGETYTAKIADQELDDYTFVMGLISEDSEGAFGGEVDFYVVSFRASGFRPFYHGEKPYGDWQMAYADVVKELYYMDKGPGEPLPFYAGGEPIALQEQMLTFADSESDHILLFDANRDGTPELLYGKPGADGKWEYYVYTYLTDDSLDLPGRLIYLGDVENPPYSLDGISEGESGLRVPAFLTYGVRSSEYGIKGSNYYAMSPGGMILNSEWPLDMRTWPYSETGEQEDRFYINGESVPEADYQALEQRIFGESDEHRCLVLGGRTKAEAVSSLWFAMQEERLVSDSRLSAAASWAWAYGARNGNVRYDLLTGDLKKVFFEEDKTVVSDRELFEERGFISIRGSSPWVETFSLEASGKDQVRIHYLLMDSGLQYYEMTEELTFTQRGKGLLVSQYATSEMEFIQP